MIGRLRQRAAVATQERHIPGVLLLIAYLGLLETLALRYRRCSDGLSRLFGPARL
jgi:hypothetical protein